jgi:hypothetical protein
MGQAVVKVALAQPAERVWALIADFGDTSWMPPGTRVDVVGSGPGMARFIHAGERKIKEQLESLDAAARTLTYTIPENVPMPVTGYRATMKVTPAGAGSELEWRCSFEPAGVSDAQATAMIEGLYKTMGGWIGERLARG